MPENWNPKRYADEIETYAPVTLSDDDGKEVTIDVPVDGKDRDALIDEAIKIARHFEFAKAWLERTSERQKPRNEQQNRDLLNALSEMSTLAIFANMADIYAERAKADPSEAPFLEGIPSGDAFDKWLDKISKPFAEGLAKEINVEEVYAYIQEHIVAWALRDVEETHGEETVAAMSNEEFAKAMDEQLAKRGDSAGPLLWRYAQTLARSALEGLNPKELPLPQLRAFLRLDPKQQLPPPMPTPQGEYLNVFSPPHYQGLREALATKDFHKYDGIPWPTAILNKGGARGQAQLRPAAADGLIPPEEVAALEKSMWRQRDELSDLDADVLDALAASWLQQAGNDPNQNAVADVDGLLSMRGLKPKRGGSGTRGGYRPEQRHALARALWRIQNIWIDMAEIDVYEKGKPTRQTMRSRAFVITDDMGQKRLDGYMDVTGYNYRFIYRPGAVFARFLMGDGRQTALLSAKALQFDPERQRPEKRLTRYLSWQWRTRARSGGYLNAYRVRTLLKEAGSEENRRRGGRIRDRMEKALDALQQEGVISAWQYERWDEATAERRDWFSYWLQALIVVEPPDEVLEHYQSLLQKPKEGTVPPSPPDLGERIKTRRQQEGLTQLQAAEQIGISRSYLARLENGSSKNPSAGIHRKLLAWLGAEG